MSGGEDVIYVAARFRNRELAALGRDRLRRFQARSAGKVRYVVPPPGEVPLVVAGPIRGLDLDDAIQVVLELDGTLISTVGPPTTHR